jgi:hypothetical protein
MAHFAMEKMGENIVFSMVILTIWLWQFAMGNDPFLIGKPL